MSRSYGVTNHRQLDCLFNSSFRHSTYGRSKSRITSKGNPLVISVFPHKGPIMRKEFLYRDVIMHACTITWSCAMKATGYIQSWWRNQMETFSALLAICAGNSPVPGEFPTQRPVTRSFDVFFDLRLNKRLSKQWWGWWFETPSHPLWRHCHVIINIYSSNWLCLRPIHTSFG